MAGQRYGVEVRAALAADAAEVVRLLAQAGATLTVAEATTRLDIIRTRSDAAVLVATGYGGLSGLAALHWAPVLQATRPSAWLSMLLVDADERRHGIGRLLLKAVSQAARTAGCAELAIHLPQRGAAIEAFLSASGFSPDGTCHRRPLRRQMPA